MFSEPLLENALPDSCDCHLGEGGHFLLPPEEFRGKMSAALKDYFGEKLEEEPWSDIEATLCESDNEEVPAGLWDIEGRRR